MCDARIVLSASRRIDDGAAENLRQKLHEAGMTCGVPRRLAEGAFDFVLADAEFLSSDLIDRLAPPDMDLNLIARSAGPAKLLIADMDSTIITVECIDELADYAGVKAAVAAITERAMRGELDFESSLRERVALLEGLPVALLQECFETRIGLSPGARILVRTMAALGAQTALVSGGFTYFAERVADMAGFAHARANVLEHRDGKLTGKVVEPILGRDAKRVALDEYVAELAISRTEVITVGDGANDLAMIEAAGLGVAYKAKPSLANVADASINHSDLTAILAFQGIARTQWVLD